MSHYRLHTVEILVPCAEATELSGDAKKLLLRLRKTEGFTRKREGDSLVWVAPISHPGTAPFYCHSGSDDANEMVEMQQTREKELRVRLGDKPELVSGSDMKDASREDWLQLVPAKYENLEKAMEAHIHADDWEDILPQFQRYGDGRSRSGRGIMAEGRKKLYNPVRATISVMCAVANYDCKVPGCDSKKGEPCKPVSDDPNEFAADKFNFNGERNEKKSYRFRVHKSRLNAYRGTKKTGTSALERDLNHNVRHHNSRFESTSINFVNKDKDVEIKPITLNPGIELHQIQLKRSNRGEVTKSQSGKVTLELDPEVKMEYNPDSNNANSSTDGWWPQVHIDQTTDDMRKIAEALKAKSFGFILLCCPSKQQKQNRVLGIISVRDLESLANHLD
jgi:hypothetical protein